MLVDAPRACRSFSRVALFICSYIMDAVHRDTMHYSTATLPELNLQAIARDGDERETTRLAALVLALACQSDNVPKPSPYAPNSSLKRCLSILRTRNMSQRSGRSIHGLRARSSNASRLYCAFLPSRVIHGADAPASRS
jgi:hypothetical protein